MAVSTDLLRLTATPTVSPRTSPDALFQVVLAWENIKGFPYNTDPLEEFLESL